MEDQGIAVPAYDLDAVRDEFEVTAQGITYLNHGGMSPLPRPVKDIMIKVTKAIAAHGSRVYEEVMEPLFEELPTRIATFVNAEPDEVAFVQNTSTGINVVAQSMPLNEGDNVLLCDVEFPSNVYPWMNLQNKGVETRFVPAANGGMSIEALERARDARSRVVAVSAVQFLTGRREDLVAIGTYCAEHDLWLVVDAIQAAGIVPLDMKAMGIHALVSGGQKALCAPPGQGFMVIGRDLMAQMTPVFAGALSVKNWEHWLDYDLSFQEGAARFGTGTPNITGLAGLHAALGLLERIGVANIAEWVTHLSNVMIDDLKAHGYRVITPEAPENHAHIVTFAWEHGDPMDAVKALDTQDIILREHLDADGNPYLRVSTHCYNTEDELQRVCKVLEEEKI